MSYTGPCPAGCGQLFIGVSWSLLARHLRREWQLPEDDIEVLVEWTKMIVKTQIKNDKVPVVYDG